MFDGRNSWRLKSHFFLSDWASFELHYELACSGGDIQESSHSAGMATAPGIFGNPALFGLAPRDEHRLMDLTAEIAEEDQWTLYHRLDRLCLTLGARWGRLSLGRQSISWGNGFLFNPLDLVNPFSPVDMEREYKTGEDMITAQVSAGKAGSLQLVCVSRRNPASDDIAWDQTSVAGKLHSTYASTEFDLLMARHYRDVVFGFGSIGYLGDAAWRLDATWTILSDNQERNGCATAVANMDYSWTWWDRNCYGFVELFVNDLGTDSYSHAWFNTALSERLVRGELFTLGQTYVCAQFRTEVHPLFNLSLTGIHNSQDPSGIVQPRAVWDMAQNVQVVLGGNIMYGGKGSEFGGFQDQSHTTIWRLPDSLYLLFNYYF